MPTFDATRARTHLIRALEADLIGPYDLPEDGEADTAEEVLRLPPSRWYLTGFLAPTDRREAPEPLDDEVAAGTDDATEPAAALGAKRKSFLPASIGLSVLLPPADGDGPTTTVRAEARWAEYVPETQTLPAIAAGKSQDDESRHDAPAHPLEPGDAHEEPATRTVWRRVPCGPYVVDLSLDSAALARGVELPEAPGVRLVGRLVAADAPGLPAGTRALVVFLVNERAGRPGSTRRPDEQFLFQVHLALEYEPGFQPRPDHRGERSEDGDEDVADLLFRDRVEWAVGHGVSIETLDAGPNDRVRRVATSWMPRCEVPRVEPRRVEGLDIGMETLAERALADDPSALRDALEPLPAAYETWLDEQAAKPLEGSRRRETRERLLADARRARERIVEGIDLLIDDPLVREAFGRMNRVMADQSRRQRPGQEPRWRLFQIAFILLGLPSVVDPRHPDRGRVELIYFPTGGGKTEAYLGAIAIVLLLRRLRGGSRPDAGEGVAVILRYTLRLLTLDQLARAAALVCALEIERRAHSERLGEARFAVGLWVGKSATANTLADAAKSIQVFRNRRDARRSWPCPLTACPRCKTPLDRNSLRVVPSPRRPEAIHLYCVNDACEFHVDHSPRGLPVLFVDEQIYRELPAFLIATVDKFAMMPWRGETAMFFGRVTGRREGVFVGPHETRPADARPLPGGLQPPELIVQDELHLISGPLGTMVGLYETVVDALATRRAEADRPAEGALLRPKILAATATVRQATQQVRALFGRDDPPSVFPPPVLDDGETFFAEVDDESPGRLYVGVAAPGRAMKALLLRTYLALLTAARAVWESRGDSDDERVNADAYMTLVGYFNSLRELGGMRRLVEDEVATRADRQSQRRPLDATEAHRWARDRSLRTDVLELTSRERTGAIAETKERTEQSVDDEGRGVDVLLASNMISVGVDIDRLGLMVIAGQPKTTAEYIQASSRVGRKAKRRPGLVVTCFNVHRPRDRSHYERFGAYHSSFYRDVEASSLTPFSGPALERGLAGTLLALTRLSEPSLTPNPAASAIADHRRAAEDAVRALAARAAAHRSLDREVLRCLEDRIEQLGSALLDDWETLVREARDDGSGRRYSPWDRDKTGGPPLLHTVADPRRPASGTRDARFAAPTSMRDVEPSVPLWLQEQPLGGYSS